MSIIIAILSLLAGIVGLVVLLSYAIVWYERSNLDAGLFDERFTIENLGLAAWLIFQETFLLFLTVLLNPLGWIKWEKAPAEAGSGTPILLLHGLFHNRACWFWTRYRLRRRGLRNVYAINLPPWHGLETLTERVAEKVEELSRTTGSDKVHLVGHSMGGMIARHFILHRGGAGKVDSCIQLGAPNHGSKLAPFAITDLGRLLLPGSDFLQQVAETPLPAEVRMTSIFSRHDNMVIPFESCRLPGAENVELAGMGHMGLLYHPLAFEYLCDALKEPRP